MAVKEIKIKEDDNHFLTPRKFEEQIEEIVVKSKCTRLEAIFIWCKQNEFDPEDVVPLINTTLKQNLQIDGIENGLLKRKKSLF